jgi:hypothetical protein
MYLTAVDPPRKMHVNYSLTIEGAKKHDDENAAVVSAREVRKRFAKTFQKGTASSGLAEIRDFDHLKRSRRRPRVARRYRRDHCGGLRIEQHTGVCLGGLP